MHALAQGSGTRPCRPIAEYTQTDLSKLREFVKNVLAGAKGPPADFCLPTSRCGAAYRRAVGSTTVVCAAQ